MEPREKRLFGFVCDLLVVLMRNQDNFAAYIPTIFGLAVLIVDATELINELCNLGLIFSDIPCQNVLLPLLVLGGLKRFTRFRSHFNRVR